MFDLMIKYTKSFAHVHTHTHHYMWNLLWRLHGGWYFINRSCKFFYPIWQSFVYPFKGCILHITWLYVAILSSHHMSSNFPFYCKDDSPWLCIGHHGTWYFFLTIYGKLQPASLHCAALKLLPQAKNWLIRKNKV